MIYHNTGLLYEIMICQYWAVIRDNDISQYWAVIRDNDISQCLTINKTLHHYVYHDIGSS